MMPYAFSCNVLRFSLQPIALFRGPEGLSNRRRWGGASLSATAPGLEMHHTMVSRGLEWGSNAAPSIRPPALRAVTYRLLSRVTSWKMLVRSELEA